MANIVDASLINVYLLTETTVSKSLERKEKDFKLVQQFDRKKKY